MQIFAYNNLHQEDYFGEKIKGIAFSEVFLVVEGISCMVTRGGNVAGGGEKKRERDFIVHKTKGRFLFYKLRLEFLDAKGMKLNPIYSRWKRQILSLLGKKVLTNDST